MKLGYLTLLDNPPAYGDGVREPGQMIREAVEEAVLAEGLGFASAWLPEHHFGYWSTCPCTSMALAQIAARTRALRVGPAIVVLPPLDPLRVAEEYAMLDALSGGRAMFAAGRGFGGREYEPFGVPYAESKERLREGMELIRRAWTEDPLTFQGRFRQVASVRVLPRPVQRPHPPMYVGSFSRDSAEMAAAEGYHLMIAAFAAAQVYRDYQECAVTFRREAAAHGHPGAQVTCSFFCCICHTHQERRQAQERLLRHFRGLLPENAEMLSASHPHVRYMLETHELLRDDAAGDLSGRGLMVGDAELCLATLERCAEAGISEVLLNVAFGGNTHEGNLLTLERVAREVLPHASRLGG